LETYLLFGDYVSVITGLSTPSAKRSSRSKWSKWGIEKTYT